MASTRHARSALLDLRAAVGSSAQLEVLRNIKYDLTGHLSRKADYVQNGLVPLLASLLDDSPSDNQHPAPEHELMFTQVAQLLCVIAHGEDSA